MTSLGAMRPLTVRVVIDPASSELHATQHTAWMLINLLARQVGVVRHIEIDCRSSTPLLGNVVPRLASPGQSLRDSLAEGAASIGGATVSLAVGDAKADRVLVVGPGDETAAGPRVFGEGWVGGIFHGAVAASGASSLPFGPYVAASLGAGLVFTDARLLPERRWKRQDIAYSAWSLALAAGTDATGPDDVATELVAALAGVGAVGCAFVHTIFACQSITGRILLVDNDKRGIDSTNLNRYVLFGRECIGKLKPRTAADIAGRASVTWDPIDGSFEDLGLRPDFVLSAVDTDSSRRAIQLRYPPRIISASTLDLRAELLRVGPPGVRACLQCDTVDRAELSDDEVRARLVPTDELAARAGVTISDLREFKRTVSCGEVDARILGAYRDEQGTEAPQFAVGFVSVLAGVLLAAQAVKEAVTPNAILNERTNRAIFQFFNPAAKSNAATFHARRPGCTACAAGVALEKWKQRALAYDARHGIREGQGK